MELFLIRHGKAGQAEDDDLRALTRAGRQAVERVATVLAGRGVRPARIGHSPLLRAYETADIIGRLLRTPLTSVPDLRPESDVERVRSSLLRDYDLSIMLVGHNPFMERMASLLLTGDADDNVLTFHTGSAARLVSVSPHPTVRFSCDWLITPALLK